MESFLPYILDYKAEIEKSKNPTRAKAFFTKLAFDVLTCHEAKEVFTNMRKCPVCLCDATQLEDGSLVVLHEPVEWV